MVDSIKPGTTYVKASSTHLTNYQEQATLQLIKYIMEDAKHELDKKDFGEVSKGNISNINWTNLNPVQKVIFGEFPVKYMKDWKWMNSFYKQQEVFFGQKIGDKKVTATPGGYSHYSQSDKSGFMQYITNKVKKKYGISKKDTWNPADIWLVWDIGKAKKIIDTAIDGNDDIKALNDKMRELLYHHQIVGISLKQVGTGPARWETVNLIGPDFTQVMSTTGTDAYKYGVSEIKLPLDLKEGYFTKSAVTGKPEGTEWKRNLAQLASEREDLFPGNPPTIPAGKAQSWSDLASAIIIKHGAKDRYKLIIKSGHTSGSKGANLRFEPEEIGGAARLGQSKASASTDLIAELGEHEGRTFNDWSNYPRTLAAWERHKGKYEKLVTYILTPGPSWPIQATGVGSGKEFVDYVTLLFAEVHNLALENPFALNEEGYEFGRGITSRMMVESTGELAKEDWGSDYRNAKVTSDRLRFNIVSKLMQVRCYYLLKKLSSRGKLGKTNLDKFVTLIMYMAQKKGKGFGPFGKIY